ncbi:MAG TPA: NAD(P)H-hydrate dehydratase [bacterium]|nr:NAD(P)H-hydrate dehydratase [bacterium]
MKILNGDQAAQLDRLSIRKHGISAAALMARAARACAEALHRRLQPKSKIVIVAGPGNNGGDGLAMAGELAGRGHSVQVYCHGGPEKYSPEARGYYEKARPFLQPPARLPAALHVADAVVDAIFGIGLKRPVAGAIAKSLKAMNRAKAFKLAVDMPSGVSADSGEALGEAFRADLTVTFETPKRGQVLPPAWDHVGRLEVAPIGLSAAELRRMKTDAEWVDEKFAATFLKPRSLGSNKGRSGKVWVLAGSKTMPGAGYLCARSALRAGAGLVTWALPEDAHRRIDLRYAEVMLFPFENFSALGAKLAAADAVAVGPGWGRGAAAGAFLRSWLGCRRPPTVFDADALNLLAEIPSAMKSLRPRDVLTPHWKEMSRLAGIPLAEIAEDPWRRAREFARRRRCLLVLKGYRSLIATPEGRLYVNSSGGPNLATGGAGDVLTGLIAGLIAQGLKPAAAAVVGVFLHGQAGDRLAQTKGDRGTLASDLTELWPALIKDLLSRPPLQKGNRRDLTQASHSKGGPNFCGDL